MERKREVAITPISLQKGKDRWMWQFPDEKDFHNALYLWLDETNAKGIFRADGCMQTWWDDISGELKGWKALCSLDEEKSGNPDFWRCFKKAANKLREEMGGQDIASEKASWDLCEPLFAKASELKLRSDDPPTLPAKLCHFVFPALFPVSDRTLVQIDDASSYPNYWDYVRECWQHKATNRCGLTDELRAEIKKHSEKDVFGGYPFACKIGEFHVIGKGGFSACYRELSPK